MNDKIKKIKIKLRPTRESYMFHDSKTDVNTLMKAMNECIDKINEIVELVNRIEKFEVE